MGFSAGKRRDALDKVKDALGWPPLFGKHRLDDLAGFGLGETALAQEIRAILVVAGNDPLTGGANAGDEGCR